MYGEHLLKDYIDKDQHLSTFRASWQNIFIEFKPMWIENKVSIINRKCYRNLWFSVLEISFFLLFKGVFYYLDFGGGVGSIELTFSSGSNKNGKTFQDNLETIFNYLTFS